MNIMKTYIAFLRGINVGGHNSITMEELVKAMSDGGFHNVKSYIQSGNLVFQSDMKEAGDVNREMKKIITHHFSLQIDIIIRTLPDLENLLTLVLFNKAKIWMYMRVCYLESLMFCHSPIWVQSFLNKMIIR